MIKISNYRDLLKLKASNTLDKDLIESIRRFFKDIVANLTGDQNIWETYDLREDGPFYVLEKDDDVTNLNIHGIGSIYESTLEFSNKLRIKDNFEVWQWLIMCSNDFVLVFYSPVGQYGSKFDQFMTQYLCDT